MKEVRQMKGPCGLVVVPVAQIPAYEANGFELYGPAPTAEPQLVNKTKRVKKSRQLLTTKTKVFYGDNATKNK